MVFTRSKSSDATDSREYPQVPRVGVGVVVLRTSEVTGNAEVLLIQRGKAPDKGKWTFPGGGLELGETISECAVREVFEETGVVLKVGSGTENLGCGVIPQLSGCGVKAPYRATGMLDLPLLPAPTPFTAVDCILKDAEGRLQYHYMIVEVAAAPVDPNAEVKAMDGCSDIKWIEVDELRRFSPLTRNTHRVAEEAVERFMPKVAPPS
eukprot:CAMPEP_0198212154 /NCGR_PEP_ID=MMETSP1445-20131203/25552_1 /TAXON_ID=36898 /ORGANISM="Pyramimonas sp., Strain CCMP2087" /LENGTH=207 /DNA_ID=CAMNT_0043886543 /DNA_START=436 /DNA_END=1059 /DNA_ORIENTATION=+